MKKLIALAFSALFALFSGVEVALPKEDNFYFNPQAGEGDYFQADIASQDLNYRNLYSLVHGYNWDSAEMCDTTPRQDCREVWEHVSEESGWLGLYAPVAPDLAEVSQIPNGYLYTVTSEEEVNITAPAAGKINTSHYACDYGSYMEYIIEWSDGSLFTVTIDGAKCWYCCADKQTPENGRYSATPQDSLKGKSMRAGDVLCVGKPGTTIRIVQSINSAG